MASKGLDDREVDSYFKRCDMVDTYKFDETSNLRLYVLDM